MTSDRWSRIVEDADRREATRTGRLLDLREGMTPDTAARAAEIAPQLNADPSTVLQDLPAAEQIIRSTEAEESLRGAPGTRQFITKAPVNAALASEDTGFLAGLERSFWDLAAQAREGAKEMFGWNRDDRFQGPVSRGVESATKFLTMAGQALPGVETGSQIRAANDALEIMAFIDNGGQLAEREGGLPEGYLRHGFVFDEVTGQMLSYDQATPEQRAAVKQRVMNELLEDNEEVARIALQIAAIQATMPPGEHISMDNLPDALKFYATSGAISSIPFLIAGMIGGMPTAAGAGVAMGVADIYIEGVGDQGAAAFTDDDLARNAMIAAPLYAATEFLGPFGRLVRKPFRNIPDELIMRALRTRGVPARIATAVGTSAFENAVSEMVQDMLVDAANGKLDFSEEGIASYLESGAAGALGGGPVTLALEGPGIVAQGLANREAQRDGQTAQQLQQIQKQSERANMRTAAPAQWREFMQSIGTENGKLYVEPDALDAAVNAGQVSLEQLGVDQSALEAAKEAGGRVEVSQLEWGSNYAGTEAGQILIDNASVRPDGLTPTQLRNFADVQAEIHQQAETDTQLQQEIDTVAAELESQTRAQLRAAGRSPEVASAGAKAWTAMLSTAATRTKDVAVFDQFGVDVRSLPQQKAAQEIPTRTLEQGAPKVRGQMAADLPNQHQLMPHLRTKATKIAADREAGKPLFTQKTNNKNADPQISAIDEVLSRHPRAATSPQAWNNMMADALATTDVPAPPYAFLRDINGGGSVELLNRLTEGQIADADHGFANAAEFREAYINGEISIADTGKLFLWSFLSRGVSPYTQESLFIDAFEGIDQFIEAAADGTLDQKEYTEWAKTAAPKGSGQPGAGATHNLNAFGTLFLKKMSEDAGMGDGRSRLQVIHDMMMDPDSTGRDIRRQFLRMGEGVGIDNKVVSFTLLVAGFDDVMVLDRVQIRQLWNDGRFDGINLYDGYKTDGKPVTGSAISSLTYGARGLMVYEAIEEALKTRVDAIYEAVGRPEAASIGRYHWETWVASSQQEASHATIDAILANAKGEHQPLEGVTAKEGEYGSYAYGARYGVSALDGSAYFLYEVPDRGLFQFTVDQFQGFLTRIKKTSEGVVPHSKFKVTAAGNEPWFFQEGVSLDRLAAIAGEAGRAVTADQVSEADVVDGVDQTVSDGPAADQPGTARTFEQEGARGQIAMPEVIGRGDFIIDLFASADESTFFHEMGHAGIEMLRFLSEQDGAPQQIKDDIAKVHEWMEQTTGEAVGDVYTTPQQEAWAEAFENYLMEGKAPTPTLKTVFVKLRRWLTRLYQTAQGAGTVPSPEIKRVMDRLLATDQQIEAAKLQDGDVELFREQPPFMSKDEWETYKRVAERGDAEAEGRALSVAMEAVRKRRSKEWKEAYKAALPEELATLQEQQEYVLLDALGNQDTAGGGFFGLGARLDRATLIDMVGEAALSELNNKRLKTKHNIFVKDGADPEQVAEMFGFRNGAHMVNALRSIKPINEQAQLNAEARANEIVPNLTPAEMQEEAQAALKNPQKIERTAREGAALARAGGSGTTSWQQMNAAAHTRAVELVGAMNVRTAGNYDQFRVAARKASREAQAELAKVVRLADGTPATGGVTALNAAAAAKRRQLVNEHMYTVAREQAVKFDKARVRFRKLGTVKEAKKHTPEVYDQIEQLLDQYDFRIVSAKDVTQRAVERMSLTAFEEMLVENGRAGELTIPMSVRLRTQKTHYTELTVDDLDAVVDAIDSLSHLGKSTNKAYQEADAKLYADQVAEIALNTRLVMKGKRLPDRESTQRRVISQTVGQLNHHVEQATTTLRRMDGFMGAGPAIRYIKRPLDKAAAALELRKEKVANEVKDTFSTHYTRAQMRQLNTKKIHSKELGLSLTKAGWLSMALNTGNEGNFQRLTDPDARTGTYDASRVNAALKGILDENDWRFVQSVWDHIDSYWPAIKKLEREVTGVTPNKIDAALQVDAPDFVTGGYYPIRYDRDLNLGSVLNGADDAYRDAVTGRYGKAQTRHGHTEARLRSTGKALDLTLGAYEDHLQQVVHDLELRKPVNNAMKLLNNPEIGAVLAEHGRPGDLDQLKLWVRDTAAGDQIAAGGLATIARFSRKALTVKYIGFKLSTTLIQPLGVAQAGTVVGNRKLLNGYTKYVGRIKQWDEFVKAKSDHMKGRIRVMNREINEFRNEAQRGSAILDNKLGRFTNAMIVYGFVPMQQMQYWTVDLPVFVAVYEDMRAKGFSEEDAIHEAESAVDRASGSALLTNRASFERGTAGHAVTRSEYVKQFTMLASYVHAKYNATSEVVGRTDFSDPKQAAMFVVSMMQLFVLEAAILTLVRAVGDEEKEEELGTFGHWARVFGSEALGVHPVTRPAAGAVRGYGVGGVPLGDMTELMSRGAESAFDLAIGEGDMEDILRAFDAGATPLMLPTGQIKEVIRAITADDPGVQMGRAALGLPVARE